jgi:hypothetical protein
VFEASKAVLGFAGISGETLYDSLDDLRKAGMMNIIAKASRTRFASGKSVLNFLGRLLELRQDRFFATVTQELRDETKNSVAAGFLHPVPASLHAPPVGFISGGSFKSQDSYGNIQLTFWQNAADWQADIDIDDAAGLDHVFQVVRNTLSGRPTHPYDIHEILLAFQEIDPGYNLVVNTAQPKAAASRRKTAGG